MWDVYQTDDNKDSGTKDLEQKKMKLILMGKFLFSLAITPVQKNSLTVCTVYQRQESEISYALLCGCAKALKISTIKLIQICPKNRPKEII